MNARRSIVISALALIASAAVVAAAAPKTGTVKVTSTPGPASILKGSTLLGVTPLSMTWPAGSYDITARIGKRELTKRVTVVAGTRAEVVFAFDAPATGTVSVTTEPKSAAPVALWLDGKAVALEVWTGSVGPGTHRLIAKAKGYADAHRQFSVRAGETIKVHLVLKKK